MAGRKRKASEEEQGGEANQNEPQQATDQEDARPRAAERGGDRRADMAEIARRRAAHFANFKEDGEEDEGQDNVHVGGQQARTLGPWSSAYELVNQREQALARRQAKIKGKDDTGAVTLSPGSGSAEPRPLPGDSWVPARDPTLGPRLPCPVLALEAVCCNLLAEYLDCVASLEGVPDLIRARLAEVAARKNKLSSEAALLFASGSPGELVLPDCKYLDKHAMAATLVQAATPRLERLDLGACGRGLGDCTTGQPLPPVPASLAPRTASILPAGQIHSELIEPGVQKEPVATTDQQQQGVTVVPASAAKPGKEDAVEVLVKAVRSQLPGGVLGALTVLHLGGAYRLNDGGLYALLGLTPNLERLAVPDASRLTSSLPPYLPLLVPKLKALDMSRCRGVGAPALASALPQLHHLEEVTLDGIPEVDDALLLALSSSKTSTKAGSTPGQTPVPRLRLVSVAMCPLVTDAGVVALAGAHPQLEALRVDHCGKVTDKGMTAVGSSCKALRVLSAGHSAKLTDAGLAPVISNGSLQSLALHSSTTVTDATLAALASYCKETLTALDISFCRHMSPGALGHLVDSCPHLTRLVVFGDSQLNNSFAHGHSNDSLACSGIHGLGTSVTMTPVKA